MVNHSRAINRVFTRGVLLDLLFHRKSEVFDFVVRQYVQNPIGKTHGQLFTEIYKYLEREKRNEYYFLNILLTRELEGKHSVMNTTALTQLHIGWHIADFVLINGEGNVYEIKSDLDNLDRLSEQLEGYYKAFSKVWVLSTVSEYDRVCNLLSKLGDMGNKTGIYCMNSDNRFFNKISRKEATQNDNYLDHVCIFKLLRKSEYENVIVNQFGELPKVPPVDHFRACLERFKELHILDAQRLALEQLKTRVKITKDVFKQIQTELKSLIYFSGLFKKLSDIELLLNSDYQRY